MNCKYCKTDCALKGEDCTKDCNGYIAMTNADRIRSMSDEELAKFIVDEVCLYCQTYRTEECYNKCISAQAEWFKQPAEE